MITTKQGLKLQKIGNKYMIVEAVDGNINLTNVYSLNPTAALLWQQAEAGDQTPQALAQLLVDSYYIPFDQALADVEAQLRTWLDMVIIIL